MRDNDEMKWEDGADWVGDRVGEVLQWARDPRKAQGDGEAGRYWALGTQEDRGHWAPGKVQGTWDPGRRRILGPRRRGALGPLGRCRALGTREGTGCLEAECSEHGEALHYTCSPGPSSCSAEGWSPVSASCHFPPIPTSEPVTQNSRGLSGSSIPVTGLLWVGCPCGNTLSDL